MDHNLEHRRLVVLNIPALTVLMLSTNEDDFEPDDDSIQVYKDKIMPLFEALTKDSNEEVRTYCASIIHEVSPITLL